MQCIMRLENDSLVIEEIRNGRIRGWHERSCVLAFFKKWSQRILDAELIGDFSFVGAGEMHVQWFAEFLDLYNEYEANITLDESVLENQNVMGMLESLAWEFNHVRTVSSQNFRTIHEEQCENRAMSVLGESILKQYSRVWNLDNLAKSEIEEVSMFANWLGKEDNRLYMSRSGKVFAGPIERWILRTFTGLEWALFGESFVIVPMAMQKMFVLSMIYVPFSLGLLCLFTKMSYRRACAERTIRDFLEEVDEKGLNNKKYRVNKEELNNMKDIFEEFIDRDLSYIDENPKSEIVRERLVELGEEVDGLEEVNTSTRFDIMKKLSILELEMFSCENRIGRKSEIEENFTEESLKSKLAFVGYGGEEPGSKSFFVNFEKAVADIEKGPYYGCEVEMMRLLCLALDYVRASIKYANTHEFVFSFDYEELLRRLKSIMENVAFKANLADRYDALREARQALDALVAKQPSGEPSVDGRSMVLEQL